MHIGPDHIVGSLAEWRVMPHWICGVVMRSVITEKRFRADRRPAASPLPTNRSYGHRGRGGRAGLQPSKCKAGALERL